MDAQNNLEKRASDKVTARDALVLLNRNARQGQMDLDPLLDRMEDAGLSLTVEAGLNAEDLSPAIIERQSNLDCVIV